MASGDFCVVNCSTLGKGSKRNDKFMLQAGGGLAGHDAFFKYCYFVNHSESFLDSQNMLLCFVNEMRIPLLNLFSLLFSPEKHFKIRRQISTQIAQNMMKYLSLNNHLTDLKPGAR